MGLAEQNPSDKPGVFSPTTRLTSQSLPASAVARNQQALDRRLGLIKWIALFLGISLSMVSGVYIGLGLYISGIGLVLSGIISLLIGLLFVLGFFLVYPGATSRRANQVSYLLVFGIIIVITIAQPVLGSGDAVSAAYFFIPILASILGLRIQPLVVITLSSLMLLSIFYSADQIVHSYQPEVPLRNYPLIGLGLWLLLLSVVAATLITFVRRITNAISASEKQADMLRNLLATLNTTTDFGISLSRELSSITTELNSTSQQQASGSQEQVAAVTEVTTSLEELNETASQIAASAEAAADSANQAVITANEVLEASELAQSSVVQGEEAVVQATFSVDRVRNRIELLGQRLLYLTEQTRRVSTIIDIIDEIADETHLLALNASIEAAGSILVGTSGTTSNEHSNSRGERFGVIAQEVKNLSDRSRESTEEVREAIMEMQGAVAAAVLVAEEGKKDTAAALSRSQIAGAVIGRLNQVIANSSTSATGILRAVEEVNIRCDEISVATGQQRSANQQILITMRSIAEVARDNAGAVSDLSKTVSRVNNSVDELNVVLDKSSQSLQTSGV